MTNPWGAFNAKFTPITDERMMEVRCALVAYLAGNEIADKDMKTLVRWNYITECGMVTRMGHEFLVREEKMDQYMAKYWPK